MMAHQNGHSGVERDSDEGAEPERDAVLPPAPAEATKPLNVRAALAQLVGEARARIEAIDAAVAALQAERAELSPVVGLIGQTKSPSGLPGFKLPAYVPVDAPKPTRSRRRSRLSPRKRLARRSSKQVGALSDRIHELLVAKGPMRAEAIRTALGVDRRELPRVLRAGVEGGQWKARGQKRATEYTAA